MKTLTIIDTFGFFFRLYYAMPGLRTKSGKPSGMLSGFASFIMSLMQEYKSDYLIFALDSKGQTKRHLMLGEYKANRLAPPPELKEQLGVCIELIKKMGLCGISQEGYEADDIIASVVKQCKQKGIFVRIVTHDKDLYQLIEDGKVCIYSPQLKLEYNEAACLEKYGVAPRLIKDFLSLTGDSSDNIPGVKGIGAKGAKKLLDEYGSLDEIYANLAFIKNERSKELLALGRDNAFLSRRLVSLFDDAKIGDVQNAPFPSENPLLKVADILSEYELNKILKSLQIAPKQSAQASLSFSPELVTSESRLSELLADITPDTIIAFDTETTGLDEKSAKLVGFSFCFNEQRAYYVPVAHNYLGAPAQVSMSFATWAVEQIFKGYVVGHNLKYDFAIIKNNLGLPLPSRYSDTMLLAWLANPAENVGMDAVAKRLWGYETIKFESLVKKGESFANVELDLACRYASEDAWITLRFFKHFQATLPASMQRAKELEMSLVGVIMHMQEAGIKIERANLRELIAINEADLKALREKIYFHANEQFNINSPKQLGELLFERLGLAGKKKTKTGYSTDESVLVALLNEHPIIAPLLEYREIYKLQSTYCEPLLSLSLQDEQSRIYTSFVQTGTATGRLSSKNPNLQNIPARGERARLIRRAFVPKPGFVLVGLDYSQIELRLLAHFSGDEALIKAFNEGADIHKATAINIFGSSDDEKRAVAKSINFGLIYGMGANKLADQLGIDKKAAREYIERYFAAFGSIKAFLNGLKEQARQLGYASTLLDRRRYFDFEKASAMQLAMYEREAVNTLFQGSAADIIKLAMLEIYKQLLPEFEGAKMLLQIHDELIFEVKSDVANKFATRAGEIMSSVVKLRVPLLTSKNIGKNWADLK